MPPRVFHLVYNLIRGGTEGQCARVAMHFAQMGHMHRVGVSVAEGFFLDAVEQACGPVYRMKIRRMLSLQTWLEIRRLAAYLREQAFDLLHAWDADAVLFGALAARLARIPVVTSQRDLGEIYAPWKWRCMLYSHRRAPRVVVNAECIHDLLTQQGIAADRIRIVRNVIDLAEFDLLHNKTFARAAELPPRPRLVAVARLDPEKDAETLLQAVQRLKSDRLRVSAVLAGDGVQRHALLQLATRLGISECVCFLGDTTEVPALLHEVDVGVLTSLRNEGLSNTILEYMAVGLPVVATDCGGNRELIAHAESGLLVPPRDPDALAKAIASIMQDPERARKMGDRGREMLHRSFQPDVVIGQFASLYEEVSRDRG